MADDSASKRHPALVTVGMPVYNGERWLREAVDALLCQTFENFVLIISDNASTDDTALICEEYAKGDPRVRYYRNSHNMGVFRNYDRVFELSSTRYFKWASSNDICRDEFLERCVEVLENRPDVVLAYPRTALFEEDQETARLAEDGLDLSDEKPSERFRRLLMLLRLNNAMNGIIRSDALRRTALNRPYASSDLNIMADLALMGKFAEVPALLFYRRMTPETATALHSRSEPSLFFANDPNGVLELQTWKKEIGHLKGVLRSDIPPAEKVRLYAYLGRRWLGGRNQLRGELASSLRRRITSRHST